MKIGAAAWITAVSPRVDPCLGEGEEPKGSVVERGQHDDRAQVVRTPREEPRPATSGRSTGADRDAAEDDHGRLELVDAQLDEEDEEPQIADSASSRPRSRRDTP